MVENTLTDVITTYSNNIKDLADSISIMSVGIKKVIQESDLDDDTVIYLNYILKNLDGLLENVENNYNLDVIIPTLVGIIVNQTIQELGNK